MVMVLNGVVLDLDLCRVQEIGYDNAQVLPVYGFQDVGN